MLFGMDLRAPVKAELLELSTERGPLISAKHYREQLVYTLASSRQLAEETTRRTQTRCKTNFDRRARQREYRVGDWVMVKFPQEEQGKLRKLSHPWHKPYRVLTRNDPNVLVAKVHYPQKGAIQVHQERVCYCPPEFPAGYFWYGKCRHSIGRHPKWVQSLLEKGTDEIQTLLVWLLNQQLNQSYRLMNPLVNQQMCLMNPRVNQTLYMADESVCEPDTRADESGGEPAHKVDESVGDLTCNFSFHFDLGDDCDEHKTLGDLGWEDQDEVDEMSDRETTRQNSRYSLRRRV